MSVVYLGILYLVLSLMYTETFAGTSPVTINHYAIEVTSIDQKAKPHNKHQPVAQQRTMQTWTVWHDNRTIELREGNAPVSHAWERLPDGAVQHWDVYHTYKTAIHYTPEDTRLLDATQQIKLLPDIFDGNVLKSLQLEAQVTYQGKPCQRYEGHIGARTYRIIWLTEPDIPALIEMKSPGVRERITLTATRTQDSAHSRIDWRNQYDDIEYADLGDNETHPLVRAMYHQAPHYVYPAH